MTEKFQTGGDEYGQLLEKGLTEYELQSSYMAQIREWARYCSELSLMYATPNEGVRGIKTAARRKAEGMRSGIPDICLPVRTKTFGALYIEFKAEKGRLKPAQKIIGKMLAINGNCVLVSWSASIAWDLTQKYLNNQLDRRFVETVALVKHGIIEFLPVMETIQELSRQLCELDAKPKPRGQFRRGGRSTFRK